MSDFDHGDKVTVYQRDTDDGNEVWRHWFDGVYLTTENVGNGSEFRLKQSASGQHIHLNPAADDLRIEKAPDE